MGHSVVSNQKALILLIEDLSIEIKCISYSQHTLRNALLSRRIKLIGRSTGILNR